MGRPERIAAQTRIPQRFRTVILLALAAALCPTPAPAAASPAPPWRGQPLLLALERIRGFGVPVVFSTAVVGPDVVVTIEPTATEPRAILDEILEPLGLAAQEGPGGAVLIVTAPRAATTGVVRGRVIASTNGAPVVGATVRVPGTGATATTRPDGTFVIPDLPPGFHALRASAEGYFDRPIEPVEVAAGVARDLLIVLQPRPGFVEEIVVTPGRRSLVRDDQAARLSLDREDAMLVPQIGGDAARVVEALPGVTAADNSSAFNLRGSETRDVSFVLDGLELYEPFHLESLQSPFSLVDDRLVESIEVLGGGFTADLGDRRGGFVDLSTSLPEGPERTRVTLGTLNSGIAYGAPTGAGSFMVSARAWYPEEFRNTLELGEPGYDPRFADLYVKASFVLSPRTILSLHGLLASDRLEFREQAGSEQVTLSDDSAHLWIRALQSWSPAVFSETILSGGRLERRREGDSEPEDEVIGVDDRRTVDFFGLQSNVTWEVSGTRLVRAGFQVRPLQSAYRYASGPVADPAAATTFDLDPSGTAYGAYAAWRTALGDQVAAELGLRWDRQTWLDDAQWSPRLNVLWRAAERTDLRVGIGRFCQSQRIHELDVEDGETAFSPADLSRQIDLTLQHRFEGGTRLRFDAYDGSITRVRPRHENLFNQMELFPETSPDRVALAPEEANLRGAEIMMTAAPGTRLQWWAGYAWSTATDRIDGRDEPRSWDQTHTVRGLLAWRPNDRWSISFSGTVHTGWPTTPVTAENVVQPGGGVEPEIVPGERNSDRFPTYARVDLRAGRRFSPAWGRLGFEVEVTNLFNRGNVCCVDEFQFFTQPDGSVDAVADPERWLGLIPSFSLTMEF